MRQLLSKYKYIVVERKGMFMALTRFVGGLRRTVGEERIEKNEKQDQEKEFGSYWQKLADSANKENGKNSLSEDDE